MQRPRYRLHAASLVYFDAVRRADSIREAARRLNVASSAVNRQVLALEAELQMLLFERLPGGLKLTSAGEILAQHVISVLRNAEGVQSRLDALKGLEAGHVELVTLEGLCHDVVPTAIAAMSTRHPRVSIGVGILNTEDIPTAIANGDADLGLAFEVRPRPELRRIASVPFRLGVVSPSASPLATLPHASLNDLWDHPLILPKGNFANREQLHPLLFQAGLMDRGRYEAGSIDLMKQLVLKKLGVDLMTRIGLEKEIAAGLLVHAPLRHGRGYIQSSLGLRTGSRAKVEDVPRLARLMADALVLPNASGKAPFSDMALSAVMRRMNADRPEGAPPPWRDADGREAVPHGFRASFRTWVDDTRPSDAAAAEKALAHEDESTVAARYRRSDLFDLRVPLMAARGGVVLRSSRAKGRKKKAAPSGTSAGRERLAERQTQK